MSTDRLTGFIIEFFLIISIGFVEMIIFPILQDNIQFLFHLPQPITTADSLLEMSLPLKFMVFIGCRVDFPILPSPLFLLPHIQVDLQILSLFFLF